MSLDAKKKKIVIIIIACVLVAVIVAICLVYFLLFSNPRTTPEDRNSKGIVPTQEDLDDAITYKRIVIFGVDGAGGAFSECNTPNFDKIFENGSVNLHGMSQYPTISAPNWASMLLGVTAQKHQLTNAKTTIAKNCGNKYKSIFNLCSEVMPSATFYSCCTWKNINKGIIEDGIPGMTKVNTKDLMKADAKEYNVDEKVAELAAARVKAYSDTIMFLHFDCVDHAGHAHGYLSDEYKEAIEESDKNIGVVYSAFEEAGVIDETLFICVTDHGHTYKGGHGKESATEKECTLAVAGSKGNIIKGTSEYYVTHDLASVVFYALGLKQPAYFEGSVPKN
nr:alkaline phosphatase family protein [Clostridia bacterium]